MGRKRLKHNCCRWLASEFTTHLKEDKGRFWHPRVVFANQRRLPWGVFQNRKPMLQN